jgi:hypothetical protein
MSKAGIVFITIDFERNSPKVKDYSFNNLRNLETNAEAGDSIRICTEGESQAMLHQHLADEDEADALPIRFGGEEWGE